MRLLDSFFRAQTYNPYEPQAEVVFEKTTAGNFSYTIPSNARHVKIEIGGGKGSPAWIYASYYFSEGSGGRGGVVSILGDIIGSLAGKTITGTVGAKATSSNGIGGTGDPAGGNGTHDTTGGSSTYGGGGGGATSVTVDGTTYRASGGGGATLSGYYGGHYVAWGGNGGGPNGGVKGDRTYPTTAFIVSNGHDATDDLLNANDFGYIRVWINFSSSLLFEKDTRGAFTYTIPNIVSDISIEIAGGNGGNGIGNGVTNGGKGAVKIITIHNAAGKTITGTIGSTGGAPDAGYPDGSAGTSASAYRPPVEIFSGGGGGHSEFSVNGTTYTVSGGGGAGAYTNQIGWISGGRGGGANGGAGGTSGNGGNATGGDKLNEESRGYIRIYQL